MANSRFVIDETTSLIYAEDASQAKDIKNFLFKQEECKEVRFNDQSFYEIDDHSQKKNDL